MMWNELIKSEREKAYFRKLETFLIEEYQKEIIYPEKDKLFEAFRLSPYEKTKVIIVGQDPYHQPKQAHGLAFSVLSESLPPSLRNIFKELESDLGINHFNNGNLSGWAQQGVLLLNRVFTVRESQANSHQNKGWEEFTDYIIRHLSSEKKNLVFVLWGRNAQSLKPLIDDSKHLVIQAPHPSPLAAYRGFFGSQPFSKINDYLLKTQQEPIDWSL